ALMVRSGLVTNNAARLAVLTATGFAPWFVLRTSPWLVLPDATAIVVLLAAASAMSQSGLVFDQSLRSIARSAIHVLSHALRAPAVLRSLTPDVSRSRWAAVGLGVVIAGSVTIIVGSLLA